MCNSKIDKKTDDIDRKVVLITKDTELEKKLKSTNMTQLNNRLWMEKHDNNYTKLNTKVDTMFTTLENTFEYKTLLQKIDELGKTDEKTAKHCSSQRTNFKRDQTKENSKLSVKLLDIKTTAQQAQELYATNLTLK